MRLFILSLSSMVRFHAMLKKFGEKGEKTGWTFLEVPAKLCSKIYPGRKTTFRVKGRIDDYSIKAIALLPMGSGNFIMAVNALMRKKIGKSAGARVEVCIERDTDQLPVSEELLTCLADEPEASINFQRLPQGHRNYFSKWVNDARTDETKARRISHAIRFLKMGRTFGEMLRALKDSKTQGT